VYLRLIESRCARIADPVERLRFLRTAAGDADLFRPVTIPARRFVQAALGVLLLVIVSAGIVPDRANRTITQAPRHRESLIVAAAPVPAVWLVESTPGSELYSNGLRIERGFLTSSTPRSYVALPRSGSAMNSDRRTAPAGIVFHSSESELACFQPEQNAAVKRQGVGLLAYVQRQQLYHFVIDRFGRVHRILEDGDRANHAGYSVWADDKWIYIGLNQSFLGVCFEARTSSESGEILTTAQVHAGRVLTEMLRSRYQIPAEDCVAHAQVSVNPDNYRIGYHTDWAAGLPFAEMGLPDNYRLPPPGIYLYGFEYDYNFFRTTGPELRASLAAAEELFRKAAARGGSSIRDYRTAARRLYREIRMADACLRPSENFKK
jgi:hypothetical protein